MHVVLASIASEGDEAVKQDTIAARLTAGPMCCVV